MVMPKMGESIMEGTILKWLKKEGDSVKEDESVLEVATDKVDTEIPSTYSGKIEKILVQEGDVVKVGSPIAVIDSETSVHKHVGKNNFIEKIEKNFNEVVGEIGEKSKIKNEIKSDKFYSPLVINIANRENISLKELEKINGTGENNRITKYDLLKFLEEKNYFVENEKIEEVFEEVVLREGEEIIEPDRIRKIIAERMVLSKRISPHVTSFVEADITKVFRERLEIKDSFKKKYDISLTFNPIFIKCVSKALEDFPMMNISYQNNKIIKKNSINIGIAVALDDNNLIVPVLKNANKLTLLETIIKSDELISKARNNKLTHDDLDNGTFTISNVGSFGNVMGTPIILQPQVGILAIGSIRKIPSVIESDKGDEIAIRNKLFLSHTYDHRVVDGALGGRFAQKVAFYIENLNLKSDIEL